MDSLQCSHERQHVIKENRSPWVQITCLSDRAIVSQTSEPPIWFGIPTRKRCLLLGALITCSPTNSMRPYNLWACVKSLCALLRDHQAVRIGNRAQNDQRPYRHCAVASTGLDAFPDKISQESQLTIKASDLAGMVCSSWKIDRSLKNAKQTYMYCLRKNRSIWRNNGLKRRFKSCQQFLLDRSSSTVFLKAFDLDRNSSTSFHNIIWKWITTDSWSMSPDIYDTFAKRVERCAKDIKYKKGLKNLPTGQSY